MYIIKRKMESGEYEPLSFLGEYSAYGHPSKKLLEFRNESDAIEYAHSINLKSEDYIVVKE